MSASKPVIHFAHANGVPSAVYKKLFGYLEQSMEINILPVLGMNPHFGINDNWDALVEEIAHSIGEKCSEPVIGMGHSMGGLCTFFAAHRYPQLFKGVVIMDPPVINGMGAFTFGALKKLGFADRITPAGKSAGRREVWPSRQAARESLGKKKFFQAFHPDCFDDYLTHGLSDCEEGVRLTIPAASEVAVFRNTPHNYWHYRPALTVPGVLLTGAQSDFANTGFAERMAKQHGLLHVPVAGGHMFPLENPQNTAEIILESLKKINLL